MSIELDSINQADYTQTLWILVCELLANHNLDKIVKMSIDAGITILPLKLEVDGLYLDMELEITIRELLTYIRLNFDNPNLKVHLEFYGTKFPISRTKNVDGYCVLSYDSTCLTPSF